MKHCNPRENEHSHMDLPWLQNELAAANRRLDHTSDPEEEWCIRNEIREIENLIELEKRSMEEEKNNEAL